MSAVTFVHDVVPAIFSMVIHLGVRALPWSPAASMVANAPAPLAIPAPGAVRGRVVVGVRRVNHDARDGSRYRRSHAVSNSATAVVNAQRVFIAPSHRAGLPAGWAESSRALRHRSTARGGSRNTGVPCVSLCEKRVPACPRRCGRKDLSRRAVTRNLAKWLRAGSSPALDC